jgi:hypothetical protein
MRTDFLFRRLPPRDGEGGGGAGDGGAGGSAGAGGSGGSGGDGGGGGGGGGNPPAWLTSSITNAELQKHPGLTKFKTVEELASGYVNAEKAIGAKRFAVPGKDAKPEDWNAVYEALGRPKEAVIGEGGYQIPAVEGYTYTESDKAYHADAVKMAHAAGLNPTQFAALAKWNNDRIVATAKAQATKLAESVASLKAEQGDKYDAFLEKANAAGLLFANQAKVPMDELRTLQLADGSFLFDHPKIIKLFAAAGDALSPTSFQGGKGGGLSDPFANPRAAKAELDRLYANEFKDPKHPYNDARHAEHKYWTQRAMDLTNLANQPESAKAA